ncbi:MAG: class I SAM-dependent methyltransferase [Aminivibrio sp.]|jgi:SAM-dependent methyltransferase|nr:class I SAM-dependent methyltransferase [Aminivibrio sp.]
MTGYYAKKLSGARLSEVYNTSVERVRRYLDQEIEFVRRRLRGVERVLELGAGYGRIMKRIAPFAHSVVGIDISADSVARGREYLKNLPNCTLLEGDVHGMEYDGGFNMVLCLQNGLSAIQGDPADTVERSLRAIVPGGEAFFSTYAPGFWEWRLAWFREQAEKGLIGELDMERTVSGRIVCKDGFTATTFSEDDLVTLGKKTGCPFRTETADGSSLFLIVRKK